MAGGFESSLASRIAELEQQVRDLKTRIKALEKITGQRAENPVDSAVTRQKVTYDWQA